MSENSSTLIVEVSVEGGDPVELDELTRQLRAEVNELDVNSVEQVSAGQAPEGSKAVDMAALGQLAVTLTPSLVPPLFDLLKSWVERKPSTPVKITVKSGRKSTQIEYDPSCTSPKEVEELVKALSQSMK
jgi:hypothetical protein